MKIEYNSNSKSLIDIEENRIGKRFFGIKSESITEGYSLGACFTADTYFGEYYLFINLIKWSISIGILRKDL